MTNGQRDDFFRSLHEEDWSVVSDHVPIAILSVELECESTRIAQGIRCSFLASDSGEASKDGRLDARLSEKLCASELRQVCGYL